MDDMDQKAFNAVADILFEIVDDESLVLAIKKIRTIASDNSVLNDLIIENLLRLAIIGQETTDNEIDLEDEGAALLKGILSKKP